jgi:hypothetical protein
VINLDAALGQKLVDVAIGQAVAQLPVDRERDHLGREPEPDERRPVEARTDSSESTHRPSFPSQP